MKRFLIEGEFYAEDLDDAFYRLAIHFHTLHGTAGEEVCDAFGGAPHRFEIRPFPTIEDKLKQQGE